MRSCTSRLPMRLVAAASVADRLMAIVEPNVIATLHPAIVRPPMTVPVARLAEPFPLDTMCGSQFQWYRTWIGAEGSVKHFVGADDALFTVLGFECRGSGARERGGRLIGCTQ